MTMGKFLVRRILQGIFVIWGVITVMFGLRAVSPGDPATLMLGEGATQELIERVREQEGLNEPIYIQYFEYLQGMVVGDFGYSWRSNREVEAMVIERVPATIELAVAATIVAIVIAIPLGVISATRRNEPADYGATLFSLLGISTPNFWLGLMLILVLGVWAGLFPTGRRPVGFGQAMMTLVQYGSVYDLLVWLQYITLPALTLGTYFTALITRLTRSGMVDELGKEYVMASRAKGLPAVLVRYKHVLRNTMIPIITVLGLQLGTLLGGAVITETVFNWPGLGLRLVDALGARDWPLMQGIIVFIAIAFVTINIVVDALYNYLNPQVREG
ncbi:ABC transporter permease [Natronorubrum thiooxidans]|uniref:Peptide/nickel transport system permease protein n=1 Tax=Natronorubrum thiooxidans TaxID=308853 RepID=A0A1N7FRC7_9EURY|nr:ABC transporter permease [Natronorubrum thiooxidans]SIS02893.1 peptide/nickel transport system permease protein [Natronorubrum thiooxidans]